MIKLAKGINELGQEEYYLVGLEEYEKFDNVVIEAQILGIQLVEQVDGIYSRTGLLAKGHQQFKIIYHEDVGIYSFAQGDETNTDWLKDILLKIIARINISSGSSTISPGE